MPESNVIIDLSHHNQNLDFAGIRSSGGILGIIHKATQGLDYTDPTYPPHKTSALANGLLWGAYHFGAGSDGVQQAEHFLDIVQPDAQTLLILDFEANGQGPSMTLEQARAFVTHVNEATGRWPGLYSDHYIKGLLGTNSDPSSPIAGSGCRNMEPPLSFPPIGLPGPCGNTPTAPSVLSPIPSLAPECATATSSTAMKPASAPPGVAPSPPPLQKTPRFLLLASSVGAGCASAEIVSTALAKRHLPNPAKQDPAPLPACRTPR